MKLTKLKLLRMQNGLNQWELANLIGISETHLSRIENGRATPTADLSIKLATALGVSIENVTFQKCFDRTINDPFIQVNSKSTVADKKISYQRGHNHENS
ncbi:MAG: helix-turn-helix transcriptional regulator [Oligoflexales bacterium]|nr:helix-turn-helix transcriptional regulator [Oligoflexales bacterium]